MTGVTGLQPEVPKACQKPSEAGTEARRPFLGASRRTSLADTLILNVLLLKATRPVVLCYGCPRTQTPWPAAGLVLDRCQVSP